MKTKNLHCIFICLLVSFVVSCSVFKDKPITYATDMVCNMRVNVSDAFHYEYMGKDYYFDSYDCKQSFKMNPEKFIHNTCVNPVDTSGKIMQK